MKARTFELPGGDTISTTVPSEANRLRNRGFTEVTEAPAQEPAGDGEDSKKDEQPEKDDKTPAKRASSAKTKAETEK